MCSLVVYIQRELVNAFLYGGVVWRFVLQIGSDRFRVGKIGQRSISPGFTDWLDLLQVSSDSGSVSPLLFGKRKLGLASALEKIRVRKPELKHGKL